MKKITTLILFSFEIINLSFGQSEKVLSKEEVINLYTKLYLTSTVDSISWKGNSSKCICGSLSSDIYVKAENRINFFRLVTGLNKVKLNPKYNIEAQDAAFLIKANNQLTHSPTKSMKCFNQSAANGCRKSCLGFTDFVNYSETAFITGFIQDIGADNYFVGHRKWILYSKLIEFGYGATNNSEALLTADGVSFSDTIHTPDYIAYPWNGYVPINLIFPKWSFSIPKNKTVDFTNTTITMTDNKGNIIKNEKLAEYKNYLDNTIVWIANGLFTEHEISYEVNSLEKNGFLNKRIQVYIKNVKVDGIIRNYEYFVEPIKI